MVCFSGLHELDRTSEGITLFVYSDSDWAGHRGTRKSGSSCCIQVDGVTLHAAARTQGLLALSSAEAETYASVSSACDGIFMKRVLQFILHIDIMLKLLIDNSAARQVLSRSGVGKIRHLSLKVLWLQSHVESKLTSGCWLDSHWLCFWRGGALCVAAHRAFGSCGRLIYLDGLWAEWI